MKRGWWYDLREERKQQKILKINNPLPPPAHLFSPPNASLPLRSVVFLHLWWSYDNAVCANVIDMQDGFANQ
jgi:hypothetical protein